MIPEETVLHFFQVVQTISVEERIYTPSLSVIAPPRTYGLLPCPVTVDFVSGSVIYISCKLNKI